MKLRALLCWVVGHDFKVLARTCHRSWLHASLSSLAGTVAVCRRCDKKWDDICSGCRARNARAS